MEGKVFSKNVCTAIADRQAHQKRRHDRRDRFDYAEADNGETPIKFNGSGAS